MNNNLGIIIANRLKILAKEKGVKLGDLLKELSLGINIISKWENGSIPLIDKVYLFSNYFDVSMDYLVGKTDIKNTNIDSSELNHIIQVCNQKLNSYQIDTLVELIQILLEFWEKQND